MPQEFVGIGIEKDVVFILLLLEMDDDAEDEVEALFDMVAGLFVRGERVIVSELAILCRKFVGSDELDNGSC